VLFRSEAVTRAENLLKTLMLPERRDQLWSRALRPTTPPGLESPRLSLEEAVSSALVNRPEVAQLEMSAEINKINTRYFDNQTKPQVDLVGNYSLNGLAGSLATQGPNPLTSGLGAITDRVNELSARAGLPELPATGSLGTLPDNLIGGYGQSLSNLLGQKFPTASVGVRITLPLRNRTAEANLGRSLAEGRRITNQREQLEQVIESDVRNSLQAVRSAERRLAAATASRASAEQQYNSEQRKFQAGTSTLFLVLQRQTDLIAARGSELQAQTDLNKAITSFRRATGNTLQAHNVSIETGSPERRLKPSSRPDALDVVNTIK
jgi:outer membrane protein TolC